MTGVPGHVRRAVALSPGELFVTARTAVLLLVTETLLRLHRLDRIALLMGVVIDGRAQRRAPGTAPVVLSARERRGLRCVRRVLRLVPRTRGLCLREALLTGHVLRRRSPTLEVGVLESRECFVAHAWIEIDGVAVGRPVPDRLAGWSVPPGTQER